MPTITLPGEAEGGQRAEFRWLMESDVCKHCTHAACLDVCPTGALFRTEFGTVVVQDDICNGCGYCVPACPFGVIDKRVGEKGVTKNEGIAQKCTLCYDRLGDGLQPACATACPTQSIQYGDVDELRERAQKRVDALHEAGVHDARLYGENSHDGVGGLGAFFLLLDEPEVYGLPPDPVVTTKDLPEMWRKAALAAARRCSPARSRCSAERAGERGPPGHPPRRDHGPRPRRRRPARPGARASSPATPSAARPSGRPAPAAPTRSRGSGPAEPRGVRAGADRPGRRAASGGARRATRTPSCLTPSSRPTTAGRSSRRRRGRRTSPPTCSWAGSRPGRPCSSPAPT